jgi:penicillin-binding protein 1C
MRRAARALIALSCLLFAGALARDELDAWVAATRLPPLVVETGAVVLDRDGRLLRAYTVADGRWRLPVTLAGVDPRYVALLTAYEDRRFATHPGVDAVALLRAALQSARAGRVVSGGSTLTMQVARLLEDSGTGRLAGKLRQIRVALALERQLAKPQILELYLHLAPFGGNIEGVRAASLSWFGKEPARLTAAEAALLVALPQSPEARRPDRHPDAAFRARDRVLTRAARAGALPQDEAAAARREPVPDGRRPYPALAPHLSDRMRQEHPGAAEVRLTLDARLQAALESLAAEAVRGQGARLSAAILVADHRSGEVLVSVGSAGFTDAARGGFVDMTRAVRSPGSTLKPLVYGLAFDAGLAHPETLIEDRPVAFGTYAPQNFDRRFRGTVRVREALQASLNIPVVMLTEAIGPAQLVARMRRAGMAPRLAGQPGLAVALGGVGVTLEDLVTLYAGIAEGGVPVALHHLPAPAAGPRPRLMSAEAAWQVADILAGVPPPPGARPGRLAYKTGTSYGHRDAWAIGFDGAHVVGVWLGRPDGTPVPGGFGADLAAPVLFQAFGRLSPDPVPLPPPPPATLILPTADLPQPLQRFRPRDAVFAAPAGPEIAFPPDGARMAPDEAVLVARVRNGTPPFTWLADGVPVAVARRERQAEIAAAGPGFVTLSVIDAEGRSAQARLELR